MKTQLILLDTPIIVSDEKVEKGNFTYKQEINTVIEVKEKPTSGNWGKKIIAGIPGLPSIDYNGFEEQLEIIDVEKLAENLVSRNGTFKRNRDNFISWDATINGFIKGFKAAQKINEKKFSEESLRLAMRLFHDRKLKTINDIIQYLSHPKVFDIEIEMEEYCFPMPNIHVKEYRPKITDNSIKIVKIL